MITYTRFGGRTVKKCENFSISPGLHFYSRRVFTRASRRPRERRADPRCRAGTHARSSAGYYFSRRIFPQMNFMKTVFALLINRSSVARPPAPYHRLHGSSPVPCPVHSFRHSVDSRGSQCRTAAFNNNIVSRTTRSTMRSFLRFNCVQRMEYGFF